MTNSWMQFSPGSPDYFGGAGGQTIPPWMQRSLGRATAASGVSPQGSAPGAPEPSAPSAGAQGGPQAGMFDKWQNQQQDTDAPDWFQHFQTQWLQNQQQSLAQGAPAPAQPSAPQPQSPGVQPPPTSPVMSAGFSAPPPSAPEYTPEQPASRAPPGAPLVPPAPSPPAAVQPPAPTSGYQPGLGSSVTNGWFHDNNPTGGTYAGDWGGQPIYYHYGNQSAEDQYNSQFPGQTAAPAPNPVETPAPAPTPPPAPSPAPTYNAPIELPTGEGSRLPEAVGGQLTGQQWTNQQEQSNAGFGWDVPEALGGSMKMARGGAVRRFANGGAASMSGSQGLAGVAQQLQSYGRGPDKMLAHISPDESQMIDYLQGGRKTNPMTGLPEYSMFGNILKAVARAAGAIGGFAIGGPAGAALGAGAATKLTGGSWNDALKAGAMSGLGSWSAQGLSGAGWSPTGGSLGAGANPASMSSAMGDPIGATIAGGGNAPGFGSAFMAAAKSAPGMSAGLGALSTPTSTPAAMPMMSSTPTSSINLNVKPQPRKFNPYIGDPNKFAEVGADGKTAGGMGHTFYTPLLPIPEYNDTPVQGDGQQLAGLGFARGGRVRGYAEGGDVDDDSKTWWGGEPTDVPMLRDPATRQRAYEAAMGFMPIGSVGKAKGLASAAESRFFEPSGSQLRDLVDNENVHPQQALKEARDLLKWAENKITDPAWRTHAINAMMQAKSTIQKLAPKANKYANGGRIRRFANGGAMGGGPMMPKIGAGIMDGPTAIGQPGGALSGPGMPGAAIGAGAPQAMQMRRAALAGYSMFAKGGAPHEGPVRGPGTGTSDSIPARLSNGEHVFTAREVSNLGDGDNEAGQKATYALRRAIKKNPAKVRAMVRGLGAA